MVEIKVVTTDINTRLTNDVIKEQVEKELEDRMEKERESKQWQTIGGVNLDEEEKIQGMDVEEAVTEAEDIEEEYMEIEDSDEEEQEKEYWSANEKEEKERKDSVKTRSIQGDKRFDKLTELTIREVRDATEFVPYYTDEERSGDEEELGKEPKVELIDILEIDEGAIFIPNKGDDTNELAMKVSGMKRKQIDIVFGNRKVKVDKNYTFVVEEKTFDKIAFSDAGTDVVLEIDK